MIHLLLAIIYISFISLGLPDALLGSAWPIMYQEFNVPVSYAGMISMIISFGTIIASLQSDRLTRKFGTGMVTAFSVAMTALALFGFSTSSSFLSLCLWAIPYGLGAGGVDASLNNYVALHYASRHMSWLHCMWGVGTSIGPYIMSYALTHTVWTDGYRTVSYIQIVIAAVLIFTLPLWKVNKSKEEAEADKAILGIKGTLRIKGVLPMLFAFMAYCAAEATAMHWTSSYMEGAKGATKDEAAALGALFFIGMTVGRFFAGFVSDRLGDRRMIYLGVAIALCGIVGTAIPIKLVSTAGFIVLGLGCAPIYPCIIHSIPDKFGAENSQAIIGMHMAGAYVGATFMPPLFGLLANYISIKLMPMYLLLFMLMMILLLTRADRITKNSK